MRLRRGGEEFIERISFPDSRGESWVSAIDLRYQLRPHVRFQEPMAALQRLTGSIDELAALLGIRQRQRPRDGRSLELSCPAPAGIGLGVAQRAHHPPDLHPTPNIAWIVWFPHLVQKDEISRSEILRSAPANLAGQVDVVTDQAREDTSRNQQPMRDPLPIIPFSHPHIYPLRSRDAARFCHFCGDDRPTMTAPLARTTGCQAAAARRGPRTALPLPHWRLVKQTPATAPARRPPYARSDRRSEVALRPRTGS